MTIETPYGAAFDVKAMVASPDQKLLAIGGNNQAVDLWDLTTGELCGRLEGNPGGAFSLAFSPDGNVLAVGANKDVTLWDARTRNKTDTIRAHDSDVVRVCFSGDGKYLATSAGHSRCVWNMPGGERQTYSRGHEPPWFTKAIFSSDNRTLVWWDSLDEIRVFEIWDVRAAKDPPAARLGLDGIDMYQHGFHIGFKQSLVCAVLSPDGRTLATGHRNHMVALWDVSRGSLLGTLDGHTDAVTFLSFSHDGSTLASSSNDQTVVLWDSKKRAKILTVRDGRPFYGFFARKWLITSNDDGDRHLVLRDGRSGGALGRLPVDPSEVIKSSQNWEGPNLAVMTKSKRLIIYKLDRIFARFQSVNHSPSSPR